MLEEFPDSSYKLSAPEEWAWKRIRRGEVADMRRAPGGGGPSAPCNPVKGGAKAWKTVARTLSAQFIKLVATRLRSTNISGALRIHIECAIIKGGIDLSNADVEIELRLEKCSVADGIAIINTHFRRILSISDSVVGQEIVGNGAEFDRSFYLIQGRYPPIYLEGAKIVGDLSARGSAFMGVFHADRIKVNGGVFLRKGAAFAAGISLSGAVIGGQFSASNSTFKGKLVASSIEVNGGLFLQEKSSFEQEVYFVGGKIGGQLSVGGSKFKGNFTADGIEVKSSVHFDNNAIFEQAVRLLGAKIGGEFSAVGSTFKGKFTADRINVSGGMFLRGGAKFQQDIRILGGKIGGNLDAAGSAFNGHFNAENVEVTGNVIMQHEAIFNASVNLVNAKIDGVLALNNAHFAQKFNLESARIAKTLALFGFDTPTNPRWKASTEFVLHNAHAGTLRARMPESWRIDDENDSAVPRQADTDLVGFTYDRLDTQDIDRVDPQPLLDWIQGSVPADTYTPQPYAQLAKVLREMGAEDAANVVDIARHDHYYKTLTRPKTFGGKTKYYLKKLWGGLRNQIDRYGVRPWHSLLWFGGIALAGAFVNAFWIFAQPESVCTMHFGLDFWLYFLDCLRYSIENMLPIPGVSGIAHEMTVTSQISAFILLVQKLIGLFLLGIFIRDVVL